MATAAITEHKRQAFWQLVRYGVNGAVVTLAYTIVFAALDSFTRATPQMCNLLGQMAAVVLGYVLHSRITFRGHGERSIGSIARFVIAWVPSYVLTTFETWAIITRLAWPHWALYVPIWCVNPLLLFAVNRLWVFR